MENKTLEKPSLDVLLTQDLHDLVQCTASRYFGFYGRKATHSVMIAQENLAQEGYVAVMVAYESFDPLKASSKDMVRAFRTHAFPYIKNAMLVYCRKFCHTLSISDKDARYDFDKMVSVGVVHMDQLDEDEEFDLPVGSGVEVSQDVDDYFLVGFSDFERKIVRDHIINGYSLQEVANIYGISKSRAREVVDSLKRRMRSRIEGYDQNN